MYIFEKLSTHYRILLLVGTCFFVNITVSVIFLYFFSRNSIWISTNQITSHIPILFEFLFLKTFFTKLNLPLY